MDIDIDLDQFDGLVEGIDAAELAVRAAAAGRLEAIYALHQALPTDRYSAACDALVAEVACSLNLSHRSAWRLYDEAFMICQRRGLLTALRTGDIDLTRAKLIATLLPTSDLQDRWEADAIDYAGSHTTYQVRRWLLSRLPDGDEKARKNAFEDRRVEITADRDGMTDLYAYLPTDVAEARFTALDTLARTNTVPDDQRTLAQRRADAVADLLDEQTVVKTTVAVVLPTSGIGATVNGCPPPWTNAWHLACRTDPTWFAWLATPPAGSSTPPRAVPHPHRAGPHRTRPRPTLPLPRLQRARPRAATSTTPSRTPTATPPRTTAPPMPTPPPHQTPNRLARRQHRRQRTGMDQPRRTHLPHQTTQHPRPRSIETSARSPVQPKRRTVALARPRAHQLTPTKVRR
ncbi:MAG: DUF222 domain-containing protein [Micrococcales bacterium]|nr:DUF222 domain-containing protein [Micrococcales bacterium]